MAFANLKYGFFNPVYYLCLLSVLRIFLCLCMCGVQVYVFMQIRVCSHVWFMCICVHVCKGMFPHVVYVYMCSYIRVCLHVWFMCICVHICKGIFTYVMVYVLMYIRVCFHMQFMCICAHVCKGIFSCKSIGQMPMSGAFLCQPHLFSSFYSFSVCAFMCIYICMPVFVYVYLHRCRSQRTICRYWFFSTMWVMRFSLGLLALAASTLNLKPSNYLLLQCLSQYLSLNLQLTDWERLPNQQGPDILLSTSSELGLLAHTTKPFYVGAELRSSCLGSQFITNQANSFATGFLFYNFLILNPTSGDCDECISSYL